MKARVSPGAWQVEAPRRTGALLRAGAPLAALVVLAGAAVAAGVLPPWALALAALPCAAVGARYLAGHERALARIGARRLGPGDEPRLAQLAALLAADLGAPPPALFVVEGGPPNAAACWAGGPGVALSRALLEVARRTELEAAVAHCLVRALGPGFRAARLALALGPLGRLAGVVVDHRDDVRACALTRYPPGLLRALAACRPRRELAPLWFAGEGPFHEPPAARRAVIADL